MMPFKPNNRWKLMYMKYREVTTDSISYALTWSPFPATLDHCSTGRAYYNNDHVLTEISVATS